MRNSLDHSEELIRADLDAADERALMGRTAGYLYILSGLVVIGGQALPGADQGHTEVALGQDSLERAVSGVAPAPDAPALTATVSYALVGEDGRDAGELMRAVDRQLHDAKRSRRGHGAQALVS